MSAEMTPVRDAECDPAVESRRARWMILGGVTSVAVAAAINLAVSEWTQELESLADGPRLSTYVRLILTVGGLVAAGVAVSLRPNRPSFLALACLACLLARLGFHPAWDSGRLLAGFGAIAAGIGAVLMAVPQTYRRVGVSLLVLFHFGGILVAVTRPPSVQSEPPWLNQAARAYIYRPYAQFIHMTEAYFYYAPDPGSSRLLWFCVSYQSGEQRWFKLPRNPEDRIDPAGLTYHRRWVLAAKTDLSIYDITIPPHVLKRRETRAKGDAAILFHPELPRDEQYWPQSESSRLFLLPSYARHIASRREFQHPNGATPVTSIRVYLVEHRILRPERFSRSDPFGLDTYLPYFLGEYGADGSPTHADDDMMFWLVPIFYERAWADVPEWHTPRSHPGDFRLYDGLKNHTGTDHSLR